jgi:STE20-related kinase adapter protein alpha
MMKHLKHENLLPFIDSFITGHNLCIITPLIDHGSALDLIQSNFVNGLPEPVIAGILKDVLQALCYLHSRGYIHRGIRASHILVSSKGRALLSGLRDAYCIVEKGRWQRAVFDYPSDSERGLCWLSPELLQQNLRGYNEKSDIYSLGITACEMANGVSPYIDLPSTELLINKLQGNPPQLWDCNTVPPQERRTALQNLPSDSGVFDGVTATSQIHARLEAAAQRSFSRAFHRFTMLCVQHEPTLRPSAVQLLKHQFIQSSRKGSTISWEEYLSCVAPIGRSVDMETSAQVSTDENDDASQVENVMWDFTQEDI